jgi:hypothetical protein
MLLLGTLGFLNSATKVEANLSTRLPPILELLELRKPRHLLAPLPEPRPPPQGGPVPSPLGMFITPFEQLLIRFLTQFLNPLLNRLQLVSEELGLLL